MTFSQLYNEIERNVAMLDTSKLKGKSGVYVVNITGEGGGVISGVLDDGKLTLVPEERPNPVCTARVSAADLESMMSGKLNPLLAFTLGKIKIKGDVAALRMFLDLL